MGKLDAAWLYGLCFAAVALYVTTATLTAISVGDYHILNRSGALLAAIGAVAVIWQVLVEERFERGNERDHQAASPSELSPAHLAMGQRIVSARTTARRRHRVRIVSCIAFVVMVGEVLHGWGDLIGNTLGPSLQPASEGRSRGQAEGPGRPEKRH